MICIGKYYYAVYPCGQRCEARYVASGIHGFADLKSALSRFDSVKLVLTSSTGNKSHGIVELVMHKPDVFLITDIQSSWIQGILMPVYIPSDIRYKQYPDGWISARAIVMPEYDKLPGQLRYQWNQMACYRPVIMRPL